MSILTAVTNGKTTCIASDTWTFEGDIIIRDQIKWICLSSGWWVGSTGDTRANKLAEQYLIDSNYDAAGLAHRWRQVLRDDGWAVNAGDGRSPTFAVSAILARPGEVWSVGSDFCVRKANHEELVAIGVGREVALGSDWAIKDSRYAVAATGLRRVRGAVEAAMHHHVWCGGRAWSKQLEQNK